MNIVNKNKLHLLKASNKANGKVREIEKKDSLDEKYVKRLRQEAKNVRSKTPDMYIGPKLDVVGDVLFILYAHIDGYFRGKLIQWMDVNNASDVSLIHIGKDGEVHGNLIFDIESRLHLRIDGGKVFGDVQVDELSIYDGSVIKGNITCRNMTVAGSNIEMLGKVSIGSTPVSSSIAKENHHVNEPDLTPDQIEKSLRDEYYEQLERRRQQKEDRKMIHWYDAEEQKTSTAELSVHEGVGFNTQQLGNASSSSLSSSLPVHKSSLPERSPSPSPLPSSIPSPLPSPLQEENQQQDEEDDKAEQENKINVEGEEEPKADTTVTAEALPDLPNEMNETTASTRMESNEKSLVDDVSSSNSKTNANGETLSSKEEMDGVFPDPLSGKDSHQKFVWRLSTGKFKFKSSRAIHSGDTHLSEIMRDGSEDSDTGLDDKNRPDNALQSEESVDSSVTDNVNNGDGGSNSSAHHNDTIDASKQSTSTSTDATNPAAATTTTATTSDNITKADPATTAPDNITKADGKTDSVDPIKDDGFCGYHCWSYYFTNPSFGNMRDHFLGNTVVTQAIKELYPYYDSGNDSESSAVDSYTYNTATMVTKFAQILESSGLRYPYTPLLRYLDLKQQRNASAVSGKLTMSKLSNAIKEKIAVVLSSSSHSKSSHNNNTSPETISALILETFLKLKSYRDCFLSSGSGTHANSAEELLTLSSLFGMDINDLMTRDSTSSAGSTSLGNPLWATDNSHMYFATLCSANVHLTLLADSAGGDAIDYDMVSDDKYAYTLQLTFHARHYSVLSGVGT